jgi:hypothetical protein
LKAARGDSAQKAGRPEDKATRNVANSSDFVFI